MSSKDREEPVPEPSEVIVFSTTWCGHCIRLKRQLSESGIAFQEIDIDVHEQFGDLISAQTGGFRTVPAVRVGEKLLVNPSLVEVKDALAA